MEYWFFTLQAFSTLLVIVDPFGNIPLFLLISDRMTRAQRRRLAWTNSWAAAATLIIFALAGSTILRIFSIDFPAMRIGGGIVMVAIAMNILSGKQFHWSDAEEPSDAGGYHRGGIVPLAIPLMAGPGAMATTMVLIEKSQNFLEIAIVLACIVTVCVLSALCYVLSPFLIRRLGRTGVVTISSIFGLILIVLAVQFVIDGFAQLMPGLFNANVEG